MQTDLQRLDNHTPMTLLDIASAVSIPKKTVTGTQKKRKLSSWNEGIVIAVKRSKTAHVDWKDAGCPRKVASQFLARKTGQAVDATD